MNPALLAAIAMANRRRADEEEAEREEYERKRKCEFKKLKPRPMLRRPSSMIHAKPVDQDESREKDKEECSRVMLGVILAGLLFVGMLLLVFGTRLWE